MAPCYRAMLVFYGREITIIRPSLLIAVYFNSRHALKREGDKLIWNECFRDEFQLTSAKPRTT